jgi:hypothetical protein
LHGVVADAEQQRPNDVDGDMQNEANPLYGWTCPTMQSPETTVD